MHLIATGEFHDSLVTVNQALHGSIPDVQVGQLVGLLDLVAMCVEQLERGSVEWRREGFVGSLPASGGEPSQQVSTVNAKLSELAATDISATQVRPRHAKSGGTAANSKSGGEKRPYH